MFLRTSSLINLSNFKQINNFCSSAYLFLNIKWMRTHAKVVTEKKEKKLILQENLGITAQKAVALFRKYPLLQQVENNRLKESIKTLQKIGISTEDICENPALLSVHTNTVEHNFMYLKEAGFNKISGPMLLRFRSVVKKPVSLLKVHSIISEDINVPKRLLRFLDPAPENLPVLESVSEEDSIVHIHEIIFKHYLAWRLESPVPEIERVFTVYENFKYRSFRIMSDMMKFLLCDLGYKKKKLLQNGYLLQISPASARNVMKKFPTLAGVDIKTVLYKYPKIVCVSVESIEKIHKHLKDFNISNEAIQKCFEIFTLAPETVNNRLQELKEIPEFGALIRNQRIVNLLLCQNKAKLRLEHLQKLNVKCASINVLCASDVVFEKYVQEGNDRTKGFDIINFLVHELDDSFKNIRAALIHNPHWCHVPLITVQDTLKFLLMKGFFRAHICRVPIVLLYPRKKVMEALEEINLNPDTRSTILTPVQILNLCLYFIERKHHFSGDGLWDNKLHVPEETQSDHGNVEDAHQVQIEGESPC